MQLTVNAAGKLVTRGVDRISKSNSCPSAELWLGAAKLSFSQISGSDQSLSYLAFMDSKCMYLKSMVFPVAFLKLLIASFKDIRTALEWAFWYNREASIWKYLLLLIWSLKSQWQNKSSPNVSICSQGWCWCVFQRYLCFLGSLVTPSRVKQESPRQSLAPNPELHGRSDASLWLECR